MKPLVRNMLIVWKTAESSHTERVLQIDCSGTSWWMIDIYNPHAFPILRPCGELADELASGSAQVQEDDPFAGLNRYEDDIPLRDRQRRDQAWDSIAHLVCNPEVFIRERRGALVAETLRSKVEDDESKEDGEEMGEGKNGRKRGKRTIYKRLRRYWQGGQTKNALLPFFDRCGGKGKERLASAEGAPKRGRPSALAKEDSEAEGINIVSRIRDRLVRGYKFFYVTPEETTLYKAYLRTLARFFRKGYEREKGTGIPIPILPPAEELPTEVQFVYWGRKGRDLEKELRARKGNSRFESDYRALLGTSAQTSFGPGWVYQIDSTPGDLILVNSLRVTEEVGQPTVYWLIDVFSMLITGLYVGVEEPSWLAAMQALENATTDKVAFCAQYGITITEEEWPCCHLPESILADRGEIEGHNADNLANALDIVVHNTPPYHPSWKGLVEWSFRHFKRRVIHGAPGELRWGRKPGDIKPNSEACLTRYDFTRLMIYFALDHNSRMLLRRYPLDKDMIAAGVYSYPLDLWHWGIRNRVGHLRQMPRDTIRLNLLPQDQAAITHEGIYYRKLWYICPKALEDNWLVRARKGRERIPIAYEPRLVDAIYLRLDQGRTLERCDLLPRSRAFKGMSWSDVDAYFKQKDLDEQANRSAKLQAEVAHLARMDHVAQEASARKEEASKEGQAKGRSRKAKQSRHDERQREREETAWVLGTSEGPADSAETESSLGPTFPDVPEYVPPPQDVDKLAELFEEE